MRRKLASDPSHTFGLYVKVVGHAGRMHAPDGVAAPVPVPRIAELSHPFTFVALGDERGGDASMMNGAVAADQ